MDGLASVMHEGLFDEEFFQLCFLTSVFTEIARSFCTKLACISFDAGMKEVANLGAELGVPRPLQVAPASWSSATGTAFPTSSDAFTNPFTSPADCESNNS